MVESDSGYDMLKIADEARRLSRSLEEAAMEFPSAPIESEVFPDVSKFPAPGVKFFNLMDWEIDAPDIQPVSDALLDILKTDRVIYTPETSPVSKEELEIFMPAADVDAPKAAISLPEQALKFCTSRFNNLSDELRQFFIANLSFPPHNRV